MRNILFWVGYSSETFDGNTTKGVAGTEVAIINISKRLRTTYGWNVTVSGTVNTTTVDGVEWIDINTFEGKYSKQPNHFDAVVGVNYIHFIKYMEEFNQKGAVFLFWAHNTDFFPWYRGEQFTQAEIEDYLGRIDVLITPSSWALDHWVNHIYKGDPVQKGVVIPNGINPDEFKNSLSIQKIPNRFIWSSAVDRGLVQLLNNWYKVRLVIPDATLDVYYPSYSNPHTPNCSWFNIEGVVDKLESMVGSGVTDMGSVSQKDLHNAMMKASYWMYLSHYEETFCITALEMAAAGVLTVCSSKAALTEVVGAGIIIEPTDYGDMFDQAVTRLVRYTPEMKEKDVTTAKRLADSKSWDSSSKMWHELLCQVLPTGVNRS